MKEYYSILTAQTDELTGVFQVRLNPDCEVYEGHFPGSPVSPGVCNIRMLMECAERVARQSLRMRKLNRCRFTTLLSPQKYPELELHIHLQPKEEGLYTLNASIGKGEEEYQTLKAECIVR